MISYKYYTEVNKGIRYEVDFAEYSFIMDTIDGKLTYVVINCPDDIFRIRCEIGGKYTDFKIELPSEVSIYDMADFQFKLQHAINAINNAQDFLLKEGIKYDKKR